MIIHKVAIGNSKEAFVCAGFSEGTNIIFSDDNNRGKTILIQSMMYCLGNKPIFPVSFNFSSYYHYIDFSIDGTHYHICRNGDDFTIAYSGGLSFLNGGAEFKRFWDKHCFQLPKIEKDGLPKIVDFELLLELFFIGQDKRDTSNIISSGYYKKEDYLNTIFSFLGIGQPMTSLIDIEQAKRQLKEYKEKKELLLKEKPIIQSQATGARYLSTVCDRIVFEEKIKAANLIKDKISSYISGRNNSSKQKIKYENVLKDLLSLNRTIDHCQMRCLDCHSTRIGFSVSSKSKHIFDVSTPTLRQEIIDSIKEKIDTYDEEIDSYTLRIKGAQQQLMELLSDEDITLEMILSYKDEIKDASDVEQQIIQCEEEITKLENLLKQNQRINADISNKQKETYESLISCMIDAYKTIDPSGNLEINNIFTPSKQVFSGSEETIFYLVKLFSIAVITKHQFPIVIDSFRAEDLSTQKEDNVLSLFEGIGNQKIFTTTLKKEEVTTEKYKNNNAIHGIDFSSIAPSKILSEKYVPELRNILTVFAINI